MVAIADPPAGSRSVDRDAISEAEGVRGGGQLSADNRLRRTEMTATLQRMVRDPRTGEVHLPHEPLSIIRTMEKLGRTLIKIKWQAGGESVLLPDDIDSYDGR